MRAHAIGILRRAVAWMLVALAVLPVLFGLTLVIPVETWRTGQQHSEPLPALAPSELPDAPSRIWIDADPACGEGPRVDADDCLAIWYLVRQVDLTVVGISTVFGNVPLHTTDANTRSLMSRLKSSYGDVAVYRGATARLSKPAGATEAVRALREALSADELTIVAFGPLTNVAAALQGRPDLRDNVQKIVAAADRPTGVRASRQSSRYAVLPRLADL